MADKVKRERSDKLTKSTKPKPRDWSHVETTTPGDYQVVLTAPGGKSFVLSEIDVNIPRGKQATISVRTSLAIIDLANEPEEIARDG